MEQPERSGQPRVTTVEETSQKTMVEPYRESGMMEIPEGVIACAFCANTRFRRSRVRVYDLKEILLLRYPMRCMRCNQRQYGSYLTAGISLPAKSHAMRVAKGGDTWQAWTEQGENGQKLPRPMSTAMGPKAMKLGMGPAMPVERSAGRREAKRVRRDEAHEIE